MSTNGEQFTYGRTSVYNLNYHIIWCTKYRRKVLKDGINVDLKVILRAIAGEHGYSIPHVEVGLDDHVRDRSTEIERKQHCQTAEGHE